jgi:hypothetical protein
MPVVKKSEKCSNWPKSVNQSRVEQSQFVQFTPTLINDMSYTTLKTKASKSYLKLNYLELSMSHSHDIKKKEIQNSVNSFIML